MLRKYFALAIFLSIIATKKWTYVGKVWILAKKIIKIASMLQIFDFLVEIEDDYEDVFDPSGEEEREAELKVKGKKERTQVEFFNFDINALINTK